MYPSNRGPRKVRNTFWGMGRGKREGGVVASHFLKPNGSKYPLTSTMPIYLHFENLNLAFSSFTLIYKPLTLSLSMCPYCSNRFTAI